MRMRLVTIFGWGLALCVSCRLQAQTAGSEDSIRAAASLAVLEQGAKGAGPDANLVKERIASGSTEFDKAMNWFIASEHALEAARLVTAINSFLPTRQARDWYVRVLDMPGLRNDPQTRIPLLVTASSAAFHVGDQELARKWAQELLESARTAGDRTRTANGYFRLSQIALRKHDLPEFHRINDAMFAFCQEAKEERCQANVRNMKGEAARVEHNYSLAAELNEQNLSYGHDSKRPAAILTATLNLAFIDLGRGDTVGVRNRLLDAVAQAQATNNRDLLSALVAGMGMLAERENNPASAARFLGVAAAEFDHLGTLPDPADQTQIAESTARIRDKLGKKRFEQAFAAGRKETLDKALAEIVAR